MANIIRIKRRAAGGAPGAPASLANAELAFNEVDDVLYYGKGTGGQDGSATTIEAIGGRGAFLGLTGDQSVAGAKTFTGEVYVPTPTAVNHAVNKAYVDSMVPNVTAGSGISVAKSSGSRPTSLPNPAPTPSGCSVSAIVIATLPKTKPAS